MAAGGQPASPMSASWAAGEPLLQHLEHLRPSFCSNLVGCRAVSLTSSGAT